MGSKLSNKGFERKWGKERKLMGVCLIRKLGTTAREVVFVFGVGGVFFGGCFWVGD